MPAQLSLKSLLKDEKVVVSLPDPKRKVKGKVGRPRKVRAETVPEEPEAHVQVEATDLPPPEPPQVTAAISVRGTRWREHGLADKKLMSCRVRKWRM